MKKLLIAIALLGLTFQTQAQTVGDSKSTVLEKEGTPKKIEDNKLSYFSDGILTVYVFTNDVVKRVLLTTKMNKKTFKGLYNETKSKLGNPTLSATKNNSIAIGWKKESRIIILFYDFNRGMATTIISTENNYRPI
jgi:hypothetical protein